MTSSFPKLLHIQGYSPLVFLINFVISVKCINILVYIFSTDSSCSSSPDELSSSLSSSSELSFKLIDFSFSFSVDYFILFFTLYKIINKNLLFFKKINMNIVINTYESINFQKLF